MKKQISIKEQVSNPFNPYLNHPKTEMHYIKETCNKCLKETGNEPRMSKMLHPITLFSTSQQSSFEYYFRC